MIQHHRVGKIMRVFSLDLWMINLNYDVCIHSKLRLQEHQILLNHCFLYKISIYIYKQFFFVFLCASTNYLQPAHNVRHALKINVFA